MKRKSTKGKKAVRTKKVGKGSKRRSGPPADGANLSRERNGKPSPASVQSRAGKRGNFWRKYTAEELAAEQGVEPVTDPAQLVADFWPEDESIDDFIATIRAWRREGYGTPGVP